MKALVLEGKQNLQFKDIKIPEPKDNEVLVKVAYCGVCGSDLDRYFKGKVHFFPFVLGHEFSGEVERIGDKVTDISLGDRVAAAPLIPCGKCNNCLRGAPQHCINYGFIGSRQNGAMAEYVAVNEQNLIKIPKQVSLKAASLIEPLTVALHGIERINFRAGSNVVIFGAGTIGMLTLLVAKARGAGDITVIDINSKKLDFAHKLGATTVINSKEIDLEDYFDKNQKPQIVFETAGVAQTQVQSIQVADHLAKIVYIGTASADVTIPAKVFEQILRKELEITGSWMSYTAPFPGYEWGAGLKYLEKKTIDVTPLISDVYSLSDKEKPFDQMIDPSSNSIKLLYDLTI